MALWKYSCTQVIITTDMQYPNSAEIDYCSLLFLSILGNKMWNHLKESLLVIQMMKFCRQTMKKDKGTGAGQLQIPCWT